MAMIEETTSTQCQDTTKPVVFVEEEESTLLHKVVKSMDEAYRMYNNYAYLHGFGTKKGTSHKSPVDKRIVSKTYNCCKEGFKRPVKEDNIGERSKKHKKNDKRCECKASIVVKPNGEDGTWVVVRHIMEHTHEVLSIENTHRLPSHRFVPPAQLKMLNEMVKSGIRVVDAFNYTKLRAGGSPELGYTNRDLYNALSRSKRNNLEHGDAQDLIIMFEQIQKDDQDFYFDFKLDEGNHLESFFWRDKRMKDDYKLFGDLLIFDTTFKTNKYGLSCAPFVSMNHHRRNLLVGCGFVRSETISNFNWLFNTFKEAMDGIHPQTTMTDQDAAMDHAIRDCFTNTTHRLCTWHIGENSKKHLGSYYMKAGFSDLFRHFLRNCDMEGEFAISIKRLEELYGLGQEKWWKDLIKTRMKWSNVFNKEVFSGGAITSQRSESLNKCVKDRKRATMDLHDCYQIFCEIIKQWRRNERDDIVDNIIGYPTVVNPYNSILMEARSVYTIRAYKTFEEEYLKSEQCKQTWQSVVDQADGSKVTVYQVLQKRHPKLQDIRFMVNYRSSDNAVWCECNKLVYCGLLCCHALRILNINSVSNLPPMCYIKRWTRNARPEAIVIGENSVMEKRRKRQHWKA